MHRRVTVIAFPIMLIPNAYAIRIITSRKYEMRRYISFLCAFLSTIARPYGIPLPVRPCRCARSLEGLLWRCDLRAMRHRTRFSFRLRLRLRIVSGAAALAGFNRQQSRTGTNAKHPKMLRSFRSMSTKAASRPFSREIGGPEMPKVPFADQRPRVVRWRPFRSASPDREEPLAWWRGRAGCRRRPIRSRLRSCHRNPLGRPDKP